MSRSQHNKVLIWVYLIVCLIMVWSHSRSKFQKTGGSTKRKLVTKKYGLPYGTSSSHFLLFERELSLTLKKPGLNNMYIVIDNAAIHKIANVLKAIRDHG